MATARPKQARRRAGPASRTRPRAAATPKTKAPASRHRRELAAIACLAVAVFLGFVLYLGWDGGSLGRWLGDVARWFVGILAFILPFLLGFIAYLLVVREESRPRRGMSWGIAFIVAGVALAAAADAFGIFSGERPDVLFRDAYMSAHGGLLGEAQWAVLSPFIGRVGVDVLVVALIVAGILLVTGSSLRQWATHSRHGVAKAGRAARSQAEALGARRKEAADTRVVEPFEAQTIDSRRPDAYLPQAGARAGTGLLAAAADGRAAPRRRRLRGAGDLRRSHAAAGRARTRADRDGRRRRAALARRRGREGRDRRCGCGARFRRRRTAAVDAARSGGPAPARAGRR